MPYNGTTGTYSAPSLPGSWNPATTGSTADPTDWNTLLADFVTAYSTVICKDGQTTPTANLPMGGFKHTGVGAASARTDYARASQVQDNSMASAVTTGTDTIVAALTPTLTAYVVNQRYTLKKSAAANTGAVTLNIDSVGAGAVTWPDGTALSANDLPANCEFEVAVQATTPVFHLQSVSSPPIAKGLLTTRGDIIVRGASAPQRLALGTSGQYLKSDGTDAVWAAIAAGTTVRVQTFTASGTYTPNANMVTCQIIALGGGGGGGGSASAGGNIGSGGGGGGAGSVAYKVATAADIGASKTVTIGAAGSGGSAGNNNGTAGGDTSVGALCIGKGGSAGAGSDGVNGTVSAGGLGGVAGTGDATPTGAPGMGSIGLQFAAGFGAGGGASPYGGGGRVKWSATAANGEAATGYGSGGSGGCSFNAGGTASGGNGTAGLVIIYEFCSS